MGIIGQLYTTLANTMNGTAPVLSATPRFQVNVDTNGNHGLSALPGAFQSVTITKSGTTLSISGEPLGVGVALDYQALPDFVSYEVKIENERVVLEVIQRKNGVETKTSLDVVQIYRQIQPLVDHPDWGLIQMGYLRVLSSSMLRAYVTLGPIEVVDDDDDEDDEDDSTH